MDQGQASGLFARGVGARLAEARGRRGLELSEVAAQTRVPLRHLEAIEQGRHEALPAATYAAGFVRTYAEMLGLDGATMAREYRAELSGRDAPRHPTAPFEPADPARIPPRALAITALVIAALLVGVYLLWRGGAFGGDSAEDRARLAARTDTAPPAPATRIPVAPAPALAPAAAGGAVVLTATEPVWVRVRDGGTTLIERVLAANESFTVPASAAAPELLTGRPQALKVTVGATAIPPLGRPEQRIDHVSLLAPALLARPRATGASPAPARADRASAAAKPAPRRRPDRAEEAAPAQAAPPPFSPKGGSVPGTTLPPAPPHP